MSMKDILMKQRRMKMNKRIQNRQIENQLKKMNEKIECQSEILQEFIGSLN